MGLAICVVVFFFFFLACALLDLGGFLCWVVCSARC